MKGHKVTISYRLTNKYTVMDSPSEDPLSEKDSKRKLKASSSDMVTSSVIVLRSWLNTINQLYDLMRRRRKKESNVCQKVVRSIFSTCSKLFELAITIKIRPLLSS